MLTLNFNTVFICFHLIWSGDCGAFRNRRDWRGWGDIRSEKISVTHSLSTWNNRDWVKIKFLTPSLNATAWSLFQSLVEWSQRRLQLNWGFGQMRPIKVWSKILKTAEMMWEGKKGHRDRLNGEHISNFGGCHNIKPLWGAWTNTVAYVLSV